MSLAHPCPTPSTAQLLDTPLDQLLADLDVELVQTRITDRKFTGYVVPEDGHLVLALPAGRSESERDMITRHLLGTSFRVPMPPLPGEYEITVLEPELLAV
ncbi:hypothetical protein OG785_45415 [Streptomyces sp. NBC_00006]|uniref:hypothetical protein n=1 Tax=Streptomyces sp. NBC_00006 TaxID=2975619 RepID=UPI002253A398|nr:hypothetical protein [Streptomyces sp. NBC_00006]MCX5528969.1 hypothetical protein [Streptomyces sp. NBC_00006]MCX5537799.1 hypothetical protein [Streptomyces sp. NBC_00006]